MFFNEQVNIIFLCLNSAFKMQVNISIYKSMTDTVYKFINKKIKIVWFNDWKNNSFKK